MTELSEETKRKKCKNKKIRMLCIIKLKLTNNKTH